MAVSEEAYDQDRGQQRRAMPVAQDELRRREDDARGTDGNGERPPHRVERHLVRGVGSK